MDFGEFLDVPGHVLWTVDIKRWRIGKRKRKGSGRVSSVEGDDVPQVDPRPSRSLHLIMGDGLWSFCNHSSVIVLE
jgi:hypothetical protein